LLFLGSEGSGAHPWRLAFYSYMVCQKVKEGETDACGVCPSCVKSGQLIHPDIHFLSRLPVSRVNKPVSTDYISEWREFISQYPYGNAMTGCNSSGGEQAREYYSPWSVTLLSIN